MFKQIIFITALAGLELLVFLYWNWWGALIVIGSIVIIEFLLRANLDNFLQESHLDLKKIPKLILDRDYEFIGHDKERLNWDHDDSLGWVLKPNTEIGIKISFPLLGLSHQCIYNTDENACRRTSNTAITQDKQVPIISILGCSFTYGHSLNDEDTYAWLLQNKFANKCVINHAVAGYSLYQSLLVLEKNIEKDSPEVVVLGFHRDLGKRNTNSYEWVNIIQQTWKIPSCLSKNHKLHRYSPQSYKSLPFSAQSKLVKILEVNWNRLVYGRRGKEEVIRNTMEHLLLQMKATCEKHGAKFIVACIDDSSPYYDFFIKHGFQWCVSGVNTEEVTQEGEYKWILYPFDNHPNQAANIKYADTVGNAIEDVLTGKHCSPDPELLQGSFETENRGSFIYPHF